MESSAVKALKELNIDSFEGEEQRTEAIGAAMGFLARVQKPFERLNYYAITVPSINAALVVCQDLQLFEKWQQSGEDAVTVDKAASLTGADPVLLGRLLRHLASNLIVQQETSDTFTNTPLSRALLDPAVACWPRYYQDAMGPTFLSLAEHLREHKYRNPMEPSDCAFQLAKNVRGQSLFEYYPKHPEEAAIFNHCMSGYSAARVPWTSFYPTGNLIVDGSSVTLVDVGGNIGQDVELFRLKHPGQANRVVLQDLPPVIAAATCDKSIRCMSHDFFTPQPIHGAKAYYLATVLHDWSDDYARKILKNIRDAAIPGYTKLLVNDLILPSMNPMPHMTMANMVMMVKVGSHERTEDMWRVLFQSSSFMLNSIFSAPGSLSSLMECSAV